MPHQKFIPPIEGLDDRDAIAIPDGRSPDLRNVRADEDRITLGPGGVVFTGSPAGAVGVAMGSLTVPTSTGNQVVTHGLGATIGTILVYGVSGPSGNTDDAHFLFGFTDLSTEVCCSYFSENGGGNPSARRRRTNAAFISQVGATGTLLFEGTFVSSTNSTFTINWSTAASTSGWRLSFIVLQNTGVTRNVLSWTTGTSTGNVAVTGAGFQPTSAIHIHAGPNNTVPESTDDAFFGLGMMNATDQWATVVRSEDTTPPSSSPTNTARQDRGDACIVDLDTSTTTEALVASFVSFDADGFTVNIDTAPAVSRRVFTLVLSGPTLDLGNFTKPATAGNHEQSITGVGFAPQLVMLNSIMRTASGTSALDDVNYTFGATVPPRSQSAAIRDSDDLAGGPDAERSFRSTNYYFDIVEDLEASHASIDTDGFSVRWRNDPGDNQHFNIRYAAFDMPTTDLGTPRNIVQAQYGTTNELTVMLTEKTTFEYDGTDFVQSAETYSGMSAVQRFMVANTQDLIAYSARGLIAGGAQTIRSFDGSTYSNLITSGTNHSANIVLAFNDRIISGDVNVGGTVNPQQIRWSVSGDAHNWNGLGSGTLEIIETSNAPLTGGFVLGERCYLTKAREIIELIATGSLAPVHRQNTIISGLGLIARHSVGFGEGWVIFLGPDSIYQFDGRSIHDIGRQRVSGGDHRSIMRTLAPLINADVIESRRLVFTTLDEIQGKVLAARGEYHLRVGTEVFVYDYIRDRWFRDSQSDIRALGVLRVGNEITDDFNTSEFLVFADSGLSTWRSNQGTTTFQGETFDAFFETKDFNAQEVIFFKTGSSVVGTLRKLNTGWSVAFMTQPDGVYNVGYSTDRGAEWHDQVVQADSNGVLVRYFEAPFHLIRFRVRRHESNGFEVRGFADYEWRESGQVLPPDLPST